MDNLAERLRGDELFAYLPERTLRQVISNDLASTYLFLCGCSAVREATSSICSVRWCTHHKARSRERRPLWDAK
jgi:hypothetical protein